MTKRANREKHRERMAYKKEQRRRTIVPPAPYVRKPRHPQPRGISPKRCPEPVA